MDAMTIVSAIIGMLGGLAMFLYGIEVMGDGKEQLRRCFEARAGKGHR